MTSQVKVAKMISTDDFERILNRLFPSILDTFSIRIADDKIFSGTQFWSHEISELQGYYFRHVVPDLNGRL